MDPTKATVRKCKRKTCGNYFQVLTRADANRRYCSQACSKLAHAKIVRDWRKNHPDSMDAYNVNRLKKNPKAWVEKWQQERLEILALLGGKCIVCGVSNPFWLHVDYVPTTRGTPYRHPRNLGYIRRNKELFRLLCANHHYELTLTGSIEGTTITQ
jgi:hypothetical protein